MSKLLFTVVGYAQVTVVAEAIQPSDPSCSPPPVSASAHNAAVILQQALQFIPNPATECMLRNMAVRLAGHLSNLVRFRFRSERYRKDPNVPWKSGVGTSLFLRLPYYHNVKFALRVTQHKASLKWKGLLAQR